MFTRKTFQNYRLQNSNQLYFLKENLIHIVFSFRSTPCVLGLEERIYMENGSKFSPPNPNQPYFLKNSSHLFLFFLPFFSFLSVYFYFVLFFSSTTMPIINGGDNPPTIDVAVGRPFVLMN